ncbi:MAG: hypothetical protein H6867_00910 [Rhodospirillales bacterium]|nr:hypothetical protein [Rhodospirillales bacterium]MCB9996781.1 hypothetical protein [Rhodospirillales bacterium]
MAKEIKKGKPQEVRDDGTEEERKHRVLGENWHDKAIRLDTIFNFIAGQKTHFVTLDQAVHTDHFDPELAAFAEFPANPKPLRTRYYWANAALDGYKPDDKGRAEIRTERKTGKGCWEQVLKIGGKSGKTLKRGEYKRALDGFGVNLDVYPSEIRKSALKIIKDEEFKPLIRLEGQSKPVLYRPDGRTDILFEIKFDKGKGFTFDGIEEDVIEVEIEVKERGSDVSDEEIEALLDKSESLLYQQFEGNLEPINESKAMTLFRHLVDWQECDKKGFEKAFKALPGDRWEEYKPQ